MLHVLFVKVGLNDSDEERVLDKSCFFAFGTFYRSKFKRFGYNESYEYNVFFLLL